MKRHKYFFRWSLAAIVISALAVLFAVGYQRLHFDADILASLPTGDPVLADARYVMTHHPIYDRIVVDVAVSGGTRDVLTEGANLAEARMRESGLFKEVGLQGIAHLIPELLHHVTDHLPILFRAEDLERTVKPLLAPEKIRRTLDDHRAALQDLGGIGQTGFIARDPLALRDHILSRLASLAPAQGGRIQNGRLVSADGKHTLIIAEPATPGMDTQEAARIAALMGRIAQELHGKYGGGLALTPVGAYRAALDNETSAKGTVKRALLFSTIAIVVLLLVGFPRPLIGLLALLPAFAGTMMAFFVYSLLHPTISLLAVGFGGAIISFTVDYGIAYLLFLDRPHETRGLEATREVWSLGLLAMLTTAISFAFLSLSGFPVLVEIGQFAALGVLFTYILVHTVFPLIFPVLPAAKRPPRVPMQRFVNRIASAEGLWKVYAALAFGVFMLFFARPDFRVDLHAMNAVSQETLRAEQHVRDVWGDIFSKVYLLIEGRDRQDFQRKCGRLADLLDREAAAGRVSQAFVPAMIFPDDALARRNQEAWQRFWSPERVSGLRRDLAASSREMGFSAGAFDPFLRLLDAENLPAPEMPERYASLFGIKAKRDGSAWTQVVALVPGPSYEGEDFFRRLSALGLVKVFDPALFTKRLGSLLQSAFMKMAAIVGLMTLITAFFYFFEWRLTLLGMAPTLFAIVCTTGTLNLLGEPLGIPTLMVSVVVIGMGTDYALYLVRAYQRYFDEDNPSLGLIRLSVFLSFATTFLGFALLALSDNALLKSAGLGLSLGIGYSYLGAVMITPPLLKRIYAPVVLKDEAVIPGSKRHLQRTVARYRGMEGYPRLFARFKIILDPMFPRLADFLSHPETVIDVGSGYGVPAVWLLEIFPRARIYGIEPDRKRVHFAARAVGSRGAMIVGAAPDLPETPQKADTALLLDMIHLLTDEDLRLTLQRLTERLQDGGVLVMRATLPSDHRFPWKRWLEMARIKMHGGLAHFRTEDQVLAILAASGFDVTAVEPCTPGHEERWFIAAARAKGPERDHAGHGCRG